MSRSYRKPYATITGKRSAADDKRVARRLWRHAQNDALRKLDNESWDEFLIPARYEASYNDVWSWGRDGKQSLHFKPTINDHLHWFHCGYCLEDEAMVHALESFERSQWYYEYLSRK